MNALSLGETAEPGVFLLAFGAGFASITLLSALVTREAQWWALWPGSILGIIGASLILGGFALDVLSFIGRFWPVGLIAAGLYVLLRRR